MLLYSCISVFLYILCPELFQKIILIRKWLPGTSLPQAMMNSQPCIQSVSEFSMLSDIDAEHFISQRWGKSSLKTLWIIIRELYSPLVSFWDFCEKNGYWDRIFSFTLSLRDFFFASGWLRKSEKMLKLNTRLPNSMKSILRGLDVCHNGGSFFDDR